MTEIRPSERDDLDEYLGALQREECYRVDEVLKSAPHETTQRVFFTGANGSETGPYIRKIINRNAGIGSAYARLFEAQRNGRRFRFLPRIAECYTTAESLVVVMEFAQGETLDDAVRREGGSLSFARSWFPLVCEALSELHEGFEPPIIHRDVKPSNIMLADGGLTLIDFGIARTYSQGADGDTAHFGTRGFAPPEQFGFGQTTVRSDVYALGMLLGYCLTGNVPESPFRADTLIDSGTSESLVEVVRKATELDPGRRYATVRDVKDAFLAACAQEDPASAAAPHRTAGAPSGDAPNPPVPRFVTLRNAVVLLLVIAWVALSLADLVSPSEQLAGNPQHYIVILQGFVMPLTGIALGYLCLDKRALIAHFPALERVRTWHVVAVYGIMFLAAAVLEAVLEAALS